MPKPAADAPALRQPIISYATILALGLLPTALVTAYYDILPRRLVVQWDTFGNTTFIGTRSSTVLMIANIAAVIALVGIAVAMWQHRALVSIGARRAFLGLNLAQIVAINLTCAMIVSDALGMQLTLKPTIPPAMAVILFAAAVLFRRVDPPTKLSQGMSIALGLAAVVLLGFSAIAVHAVIGYYASAIAVLAMVALALPPSSAAR